ncbi:transposase-like protein, IS1381 ISSpn7 [Streptococcus pneumoniae]|nr:transposase-like protein, IS1381 ISSpn7 [Streptococcus pneumoniae]
MNDEASKQLTDARFKRLVGVQRTTFEEMLAVLKTAYQLKHAKGGRKPKLSLEDLLMATLQYVREYRTYEEIAADFGIHESNLIRRSQWVEVTLVQSGVTISRTPLSSEEIQMIKILAACGAGVNSSHQIKSALEEELSNRGYDVHCDAVMVKDVNEDLMKGYDIFTPIAATDLGFEPGIPVIEAGPILFRIPAMSVPVFDNIRLPAKQNMV